MSRLLLTVLAIVAIVWLLRRAISGPGGARSRDDEASPAQPKSQGELVRCAHCGVNLPRAEARVAGGRLYCGEEHARAGPREG